MNSTNLAPTAHHPFGPSVWPAAAECIDFESIPDEDIEDADAVEDAEDQTARGRGRAKHKACAMLLAGDLATRQRAFDGLNEKEIDEVQWSVETALRIVEENGYSQADMRVEQRVTMLKPESFESLYFGTGDWEVGPLDGDFKFGLERNYFPQMVGYALPKMEARGEQRRFAYVIYGRLRKVVKYVLDRKTVETVAYSLLARRGATTRTPTLCQYCGFCAKQATCSALVATPVNLVQRREDWSLKLPTPHVSQLTDPVWLGAARFVWKRYLEGWGSAVEFASTSLASRGIAPVGFNIRPEKGRMSLNSMRKAFAALKDVMGEDALWSAMKTSMTALAKAHAASAGISKDRAAGVILAALTKAGCLEYAEASFKLIADKNAEDMLRVALARPVSSDVQQLPKKGTDPV